MIINHLMIITMITLNDDYNDNMQERLVKQTSSLGQWFTARTSLAASIVAQKLGLFHNQHFFRPENRANNPVQHFASKIFFCHHQIFSVHG